MFKQRLKKLISILCMTFLLPAAFPSDHQYQLSLSREVSVVQNYYHAHQYNSISQDSLVVSENATSTEPPKVFAPKGEKEFSYKKYLSLIEKNSDVNRTDSITKFPYHRFDVKVNRNIKPADKVTLHWEGKSLPGRQVTMYAWNVANEKWTELDGTIASDEEFALNGTIKADEYVQDRRISVIVQDQLPKHGKSYDYSFVWMTDTQYYAQDYPAIFKSITEWIAQNKDVMNIRYVFHTGDIVNKAHDEKQWQRASAYMNTLDVAKIPYGVLPGNHDEGDDFKKYKQYFGEHRFKHKSYYGGSYDDNRGHYDLISANGKDYIFVYMGWDIGEEEMKWMNKVLQRHSDRTAILSFHEYLKKNGKRSREGNELFEKVVVPNKNVVAVLCGHYHSSQLKVDELDDNQDGDVDRKVYQILADYQKGGEGGNGFLRLLHIDEETNSIDVQTYSPYLNQYYYYDPEEYPDKEQFTMDINVKRTQKMIATTYFEVNIYKHLTGEKVAYQKK
ncbi:metallophosphoesterase [Metabacillus litoralis]|uniref:metallophosphoesterase n=1 Tax=Metabacillus litoralis TaxID=152268 RepID=UPI00203A782B|nr:metallophosphoesterase [Metabacillus litoralis]MCM3162189.1 metallophosphoesterase [Metabacillus litoralis]